MNKSEILKSNNFYVIIPVLRAILLIIITLIFRLKVISG